MAIPGENVRVLASSVADNATLIDAGRPSGLLKTLSKFTQWHTANGDARWEL